MLLWPGENSPLDDMFSVELLSTELTATPERFGMNSTLNLSS